MIFRAIRFLLYPLLLLCSIVLLGLTADRIYYTKHLRGGDILVFRSNFYDPTIVALMVVSILAMLFSPFGMIIGASSGNYKVVVVEHLCIWGLWIYFLVTAALVTNDWSNLAWCRGFFRPCRILENIKAFSWICWGLLSILLILTLAELLKNRGTRDADVVPVTRQVIDQSRAQPPTTNVVTTENPGIGNPNARV